MASASGIRMGRVFVEIGADPRKFFAAVGQMQRGLTRTLSGVQANMNRLGGAMTTVGAGLAGVGAAVTAPLALAARQFSQFDDAIRATAAVTQSSGAALQSMNDRARELGATTSFTAVQVASLMTELGRAGFRPDEINAMTQAVLDLSRATGTDAALSAGIVAASLRQFGLGADDATRAADVLTFAANSTFNTVEKLGEALEYAGPVAKELGLSLEDTVSILGALGNVGIQGSNAGTALRRLGIISAASGEKLQKLFGISNVDAAGNLKPLVDILDEINTATARMPVAERTAKMAQAFGLLGITSANVLAGSAKSVRDLRDGVAAAGGTARRAAKEMDAGLGGAIRIANSAIEGTQLALGDALAPALQAVIAFIGQAAGAVTSFVKENGELVVSIGKGAAGVAAAGAVLLGFATIVKAVAFGFGGLAAASTFVLGPLIAISGMAVALTLGFIKATAGVLAYSAASVAAAITSGGAWALANVPLLALLAILGTLGAAAVSLMGGFSGLAENLKSGLATAVSNTALVFGDLKDVAGTAMGAIYDAIAGGDLSGAMEIALKGLEITARRIFGALKSEIGGFQAFLVNTADAFQTYASQPLAMFEFINDPIVKADRDAMRARQAARLNAVPGGADIQLQQNNDMADLRAMAVRSRETRVFRQQADDVTASVVAADSFNAMRELAEEFHALAATGKLSRDQLKKYSDAVDTATDRLADSGPSDALSNEEIAKRRAQVVMDGQAGDLLKNIGGVGSASELEDLQGEFEALKKFGRLSGDQESSISNALALAATQFADGQQQSQSEVAGTFSSVALGGMGFGSSLMQQIAKDTKRSADANEKIAAKQEDFEIQD
jgi:TP901 family phage tail tape measure protein